MGRNKVEGLQRVRRINLQSPYRHGYLRQCRRWTLYSVRRLLKGLVGHLHLENVFPAWTIEARYELVAIRDLDAKLSGLKIVHLSDLHCGAFMSEKSLRRILNAAWDEHPDIVAFTGDFVEFHPDEINEFVALLNGMPRPPLGVFGVLGNHDFMHGSQDILQEKLTRSGVRVLRNESVRLERNGAGIWITGIDDHWHGRADFRAALANIQTREPKILLSHNPDVAGHARDHNFDLMLSGHTHGGQIVLPIVGPAKVYSLNGPEFVGGSINVSSTQLHVSRGVGTTSLPIRINCPPEFSVLTLR